jgi:hypothetical protein
MASPTSAGQRTPPLRSPLAPEVQSISEMSGVRIQTPPQQEDLYTKWQRRQVHNPVLLIHGTIGDSRHPLDGTLLVHSPAEGTSTTAWEVCDGFWKALAYLQPGPNTLRLEFVPSASQNANGQLDGTHVNFQTINYIPNTQKPPLHLVIIIGKDSPCTYDAVPERVRREGNSLDMAVRKFKMAGYLWQSFTAEQMVRNGFGRRCFRLEEEWQPGSLFQSDIETGQMRSEAKVHILRSERTVAEIQHLNIAQQFGPAKEKNKLMDYAMETLKQNFHPKPHQQRYIACMFLDSHWDPKAKVIKGHAALGTAGGEFNVGIYGSHALQSYPSCLEEVQPAFTDCTPTDTNYVANDCNDSGSNWEAANLGIGSHLHEVGHLFGCPHQEHGIMLGDARRFNRTFNIREASSSSKKTKGMRPCLGDVECGWHRLDLLRFRFHPCFRLPGDRVPLNPDDSIQVWTLEDSQIVATANKGLAFMEVFVEGEEFCKHHIELFAEPLHKPRLKYSFTEKELRAALPKEFAKKRIKVVIHGVAASSQTIEDIREMGAKESRLKLSNGRWAFRGMKFGFSEMDGSRPEELVLTSAVSQTANISCIRVYHGASLDGLEFFYDDNTSQMFGKRGGQPGGTDYTLDTRRGETLMGFYIRAGRWIDGLQIISSDPTGIKRSPIFGNPTGGTG